MKLTLNNTSIKALDAGQEAWDTLVPGLHVRARQGGKAFYLYFTTKDGKRRRPKLGEVSILDLAKAREIARRMLSDVADDRDPVAEREKARGAMTMTQLWEKARFEHWGRAKSRPEIERLWDDHLAARFGNTRVRDVDYGQVAQFHAAMSATPFQANRALSALSKMLNLAERYGERPLGSNPCRHVSRYPELSRSRYAKPDELAAVGEQLDLLWKRKPATAAFIGIMLYTGMRPGEVANAKREWIDRVSDGTGILRLPDSKTGARNVWMSKHALALVDRLPAPRDGTLTGISSVKTAWKTLLKRAGVKDLRLYDLRRTFASVSLAGGAPLSLIGELLGHRTAQTTKVYARLMDHAASQTAAMAGDSMSNLLGAPVTSLPSAAST